MASPGRLSSRARSHLLDDLDLQPVREMRARVLNDVPYITTVPSPRVKFNFVDASFPKQLECSGMPEAVPLNVEKMACESRRKHYECDRKENRDMTRERERYDKENKCSNVIQRNEDRHEFMTQLLKKGVPVWEEVPEEERRMKIISGTNPFKHLPRLTNPNPTNITLRNSNKNQKSSKVPIAVWEDVSPGSMNSYPLRPDEDLDSSLDSVRSKEERLHEHEVLVSEVPKSSGQSHEVKHQSHVQQSIKRDKTQVQNPVLLTHIQESHSNQPITSPVPYKSKNDYSAGRSSSSEHSPQRCSSLQNDTFIKDSNQRHLKEPHLDEHDSQLVSGITDCTPNEEPGKAESMVASEERYSRPVMKRIHGGRIEDNGAMEYISWWPGDEPMRERGIKGEEEKHEREPTKESRSKRDLSAPSCSTAQPPKRQHRLISNEEVELEKPVKTPPRVRKYEQAEVRKYMEAKRSERLKSRKEEKQQQELEKIKKEERLKELAVKTKQLAPCKNSENLATAAAGDNNSGQVQSYIKDPINWGCSDSSEHEVYPEIRLTSKGVQCDYQAASIISQKTEDARQVSEVNQVLCKEESRKKSSRKSPEKGCEVREDSPRKRRLKDTKKKHKRMPISDSDSISDIVSRTVEECERQVKSSRVSLESLSSLSSASVSSSDSESKASECSVISSIDLTPKQRVISLDQMAQRLTTRITEEENNLRHCLLNERGRPLINTESSVMSKITERRVGPSKPSAGPGTIKDQMSVASALRVPLSYSDIETLSVEDLIAKMTAMLPNTSQTRGESYVTATNQGDFQSQNKQEGLINKINVPEENKKGKLPQNQNQFLIEKQVSFKDLPKLVPPDTPILQLSGGGTIIIGTNIPISHSRAENLSPLPGHNIQQKNNYGKGKIRKEKREYTNKMPVQKSRHTYTPSPLNCQKPNTESYSNIPGVTDSIAFLHKKKMDKAALVIQAAYRGYCVRRITNSLLKQHYKLLKERDRVQHAKQVQGNTMSNTGLKHNFFKHDYTSRPLNDVDLDEVSSNEGINSKIDWQKIRAELESRTFKPRSDFQYTFQRPDMPEWVKPYFVLSETGDLEGFIGSRGKELEIQNWIAANENKKDALPGGLAGKQNAVSSDSDKANLSVGKFHCDVTLTEGLLSELDDSQDVNVHEKETQTSYTNKRALKSINESERANNHKQGFVSEEKHEFVDLKRMCTGKQLLVIKTSDNVGTQVNLGQRESNLTLRANCKTEREYASPSWSSQEEDTGHETLAEGPLEEMEESSIKISGNHTVEVNSSHLASSDDGLIIESSGNLQSSNMSDSVDIEEVSAPHQLLGTGLHFGPASLRLRLNAELMYQDTLGEALNQLHNVEQLNIIAKSRQEALALSRCLTLQQEELKAQQKNKENKKKEEIKRKEEETRKEEEKRWKEDKEKIMKEEFRKQKEALQNVERMEKEARDRFAQLEREVRARAEQVFSNAAQRAPLASNSQPDVIAAAAVAAVGATISHWENLKPVQRSGNAGSESQSSVVLNNESSAALFSGSQEYTTSFMGSSNNHSQSRGSQDQKSAFSRADSSSNKEFTSSVHSAAKSSVEDQCISGTESSNDSVAESIVSEKCSNSSTKHKSTMSSHSSAKEALCTKSFSDKSESDVMSDYTEEGGRMIMMSVPEEPSSVRSSRSKKVSHCKNTNMLKFGSCKNVPESVSVKEDILPSKSASTAVTEGVVVSAYADASADTINSEAISVCEVGENIQTHSSSVTLVSSAQSSSVLEDLSESQTKEILSSGKSSTRASSASAKTSSKPHKLFKSKDDGVSDAYSESFEIESASDNSSTSVASQLRGKIQRDKGDLSLVVPSSNILNQLGYRAVPQAGSGAVGAVSDGGGESALGITLNLVESLQKEEEVRHEHQKALLKLQEQSLIEEAKWKLAALQSEGGISMRKRQRAVLLQLREQRTHLKRLIETQNIAAQQRRLMLLQHHHLLATTTSLSSSGGRGLLASSRGHSPGPGSPRLTPRMLEIGASSSSDAQDDISLNLLLRGRENGSSSPSEGGGWEKRRSHSEERKRIASIRMQEKRRAAEVEVLQQQLLHEEREILRLKNKSPYESHEKDLSKSKRKGDFITIRSRDKRDKSPTSISPLSVLVQSTRTSAETFLPEESIDASTQESQSSVPEEGGNESIYHSDIASSISEHEESTCRSHRTVTSVPIEIADSKISSLKELASERQLNTFQNSIARSSSSNDKGKGSVVLLKAPVERHTNSSDNSSSIKTVPSDENISTLDKQSSIKTLSGEQASKPTEKSNSHQSDVSEKFSHTPVLKSCSNGSEITSRVRSESVVSEELGDSRSRTTSGSFRSGSEHASGTEARSISAKSCEARSSNQKISSNRALPLPLRVPLSPRSPHRQHRRYSSESDDSFTLSQTETASDISDGEGKLIALREQLAARRAEADKLKKEKRRLRRERLASQEHALRQQISTYDAYIHQARMELEKESKELQQASSVKPVIKKPQVAETKKSKLSESILTNLDKSDVSDLSLVSEGSKSEHSCSSKSKESLLPKSHEIELLLESQLHQPGSILNNELEIVSSVKSKKIKCEAESPSVRESSKESSSAKQDEEAPSKTPEESSVSEEYSFEEETISEHSLEEISAKKKFSQDSSLDTDHTPSQASSTETIVHSPKKVDLSQKDGDATSSAEICPSLPLNDIIEDKETVANYVKLNEARETQDNNFVVTFTEGEKKLDIFIPAPDTNYPEVEESTEQNRDTSVEESIGEEIAEDIIEEVKSEEDSQKSVGVNCSSHHSSEQSKHSEDDASQSLFITGNKEISARSEGSPTNDNMPYFRQEPDFTDHLEKEEDSRLRLLDKQRLVDDISNNIFSSMMKDTALLFTDILKGRNSSGQQSQSVDDDVISHQSWSVLHQIDVDDEQVEATKTNKLHQEVEESTTSHRGPELFKEDDYKEISEELSDASKSSRSENSKTHRPIVQFMNELIANDGSSLCLPSPGSPRPVELQLTRQLTFDSSPNTLSPTSPAPTSPIRGLKDIEIEPLSEMAPPPGTAGMDDATVPAVAGINDATVPSVAGMDDATVPAAAGMDDATVPAAAGMDDATVPTAAGMDDATVPAAAGMDDATVPAAAGMDDATVPAAAGMDDATVPAAAGMDDAAILAAAKMDDAPVPYAAGMDDATVLAAAGTDSAIAPGAAVPSQVTEEYSEDQAVSPSHDVDKADAYSLDTMALTNKLLNLASADLDAKLDQLGGDDMEFSVEGIEGDWFDDDFWTSTDNRKKQQQLKAEEERIAAEIARLEELQQLQEQYPGLVIREVPNKPPPPYTPPLSSSSSSSSSVSSSPARPPAYSSPPSDRVAPSLQPLSPENTTGFVHRLSKADQENRATEVFHSVPNKQEEVMPFISEYLECVYDAWERGFDPGDVEVPRAVMSSLSGSQEEDSFEEDEASSKIFRQLLFSLVRELLSKAYHVEHAPVPPPWLKQALPPTRMRFVVRTKSRAVMYSHVQEHVKVLFGWKRSPEKETLLVRWARKHRDLVDQVLVKELQAEESSWTQYDEDEAAVKTQVACEIFDTLIEETITLVTGILARKMMYAAH